MIKRLLDIFFIILLLIFIIISVLYMLYQLLLLWNPQWRIERFRSAAYAPHK